MMDSDKASCSPQEDGSLTSEGTDTLHKARQLMIPKHALSHATNFSCGEMGKAMASNMLNIKSLSRQGGVQPRLKRAISAVQHAGSCQLYCAGAISFTAGSSSAEPHGGCEALPAAGRQTGR